MRPNYPIRYGKAPNKAVCIPMTVTVFGSARFGDVVIASTKASATEALWKRLAPRGAKYDPLKAQSVVLFGAADVLIGDDARQLEPESPWERMDTAPKDGREVILVVKRRAGLPFGQLVGHYMVGGHCIEDHPAIDGGWYFWNGSMFDRASEPLMWMPLPKINEETLNKLSCDMSDGKAGAE